MAAVAIDADAELFHGLTIWGDYGSAQVRESTVALYVSPDAQRSPEDGRPAILSHDDARRLRDLLNVATARGVL